MTKSIRNHGWAWQLLVLAMVLVVPSAFSNPRSKYNGDYTLLEVWDENGVPVSIHKPYKVRITERDDASHLMLGVKIDNSMRWPLTILYDEDLLDPIAVDSIGGASGGHRNVPVKIRVDQGMSTRLMPTYEGQVLEFFLGKYMPLMTRIHKETRGDKLLILSASGSEREANKGKIVFGVAEEQELRKRRLRGGGTS